MRGSVWVKIRFWLTNRYGTPIKSSGETVYGYSSVGDLDTMYQREDSFRRACNKAKAEYLMHRDVASDTEVYYRLLDDGIQVVGVDKRGTNRIRWLPLRMVSPAKKRVIHREVTGGVPIITRSDIERQYAEKEIEVKPEMFKPKSRGEYFKKKAPKYSVIKVKKYSKNVVKIGSRRRSVRNYNPSLMSGRHRSR